MGLISIFVGVLNLLNLIATSTINHKIPKTINDLNACPKSYFYSLFKNKDKYSLEEYQVTTSDGYNLTTFRVNLSQKYKDLLTEKAPINKPVQLLHSFGMSSDWFFLTGRSKGWYFVNKGYDVWLANHRGNKYSLAHVTPKIPISEFYNYSLDDYSLDVHAIYQKMLLTVIARKIIIGGYSIGAFNTILALCNDKIGSYMRKNTERAILICPLIYPSYSKCPEILKTKQDIDIYIEQGQKMGIYHGQLGNLNIDYSFKKQDDYMRNNHDWKLEKIDFFKTNWKTDTVFMDLFLPDLIYIFMPLLKFFGHAGSKCLDGDGYSTKSLVHFNQMAFERDSDKIHKFDFGSKEANKKRYGKETPPVYQETNIDIPMDIITGSKDLVCNTDAARTFAKKLNGNSKKPHVKVHEIENWQHLTPIAPKQPSIMYNLLDNILQN